MKAILNGKIKRRESFRPFASSLLEEAVTDWFEEDDDMPRLRTVYRCTNPRHYRLIEAYRGLTGVPMVPNTSFNENEPVVCEPKLDCLLRTRVNVPVIGETILYRQN